MSEQQKYAQKVRAEAGPDTDAFIFKKTAQVVDRPGVTANLNEEYVLHPPNNDLLTPVEDKGVGLRGEDTTHVPKPKIDPKAPKEVDEVEEPVPGAGDEVELGRPTRLGAERELMEESEV